MADDRAQTRSYNWVQPYAVEQGILPLIRQLNIFIVGSTSVARLFSASCDKWSHCIRYALDALHYSSYVSDWLIIREEQKQSYREDLSIGQYSFPDWSIFKTAEFN
jgi:hypothetical protein